MTTPSPIGEDDLQSYIDDRLSEARGIEVEAYLGAHPDVAARIATEREQRAALRAQLAPKFNEPIPSRLRIANIRAARRASHMVWMRGAVAASLLLAVGATAGWFAKGTIEAVSTPAIQIVTQDAVAAYRTFVVEVVHPVEVRAAEETHLVEWLSKRLGHRIIVPDLAKNGYHLIGGRLLPAGSSAAAMLMYDDDSGTRLTVYIRAGEGGETAFRFVKDGDVATFAWLDQGFGFAVTATTTRERLLPIAEAVYHGLTPG